MVHFESEFTYQIRYLVALVKLVVLVYWCNQNVFN